MFIEGHDYTRDEIHEALGGSTETYLPHRDGRILCACLDRDLNPDAPRIIIPGTGPLIEKTADMLLGQKRAIPVFMKQNTKAWQYVGEFEVDPRPFTAADIEAQNKRSGRTNITRVIWMRPRVPLHSARSMADVVASASQFAEAIRGSASASRLLRQNRAWVCTPQGAFAPATWAMHRDVVFDDYLAVMHGKYKDIRLSDADAIDALGTLGLAFGHDEERGSRLVAWASTVETGVLDHVDKASLRFCALDTPSVQRDPDSAVTRSTSAPMTFALLANAGRYDVEGAAYELQEDTWLLPEGDVRVGDRLVFWRTLGKDGHRGVVALGEVIGEAVFREKDPVALKFWKEPAPTGPQRRLQLRYIRAPNLPLWLDEDTTGTLASLSVSRGQGTKLYRVTPEQMDALVHLAGGWGLSAPPVAPAAVRLVEAAEEVADAITAFNVGAAEHLDLVRSLLRTTSLWVYDSETGLFGPNKFVAWSPISFDLYEQGKREQNLDGVAFDGNVARRAIELVSGRPYVARPDAHSALVRWAEALAGEGVLDGIDTAKWSMLSVGAWPDEVEEQQVEEEVVDAADAATAKRRGQGYSTDPAFRSAVELHAMEMAKAYLKGLMGTEPKNTSANHPYDFECERAPHHRFVEVKGTTGDGSEVFLTANEVEHARSHANLSALVVVHGIQVQRGAEGTFLATGGTLHDICPWSPDVGTLRPLAYRYILPD